MGEHHVTSMRRERWAIVILALAVAVGLGAAGARSASMSNERLLASDGTSTPFARPVTLPNRRPVPGEDPRDAPVTFSDGALAVVLWPDGIIRIAPVNVEPDGSLGMKFPWWKGPGAGGQPRITGHRLDAPAPPVRGDVPEGYGISGFQASGIYFPTPGCWEVTGRTNHASLTFVTLVVLVDQWPPPATPVGSPVPAPQSNPALR